MIFLDRLKKDLSRELICGISEKGVIEYISDNCIHILGYSKEEMISYDLQQFLKSVINIQELIDSSNFQIAFNHKNAGTIYMDTMAYLVNENCSTAFYLQMIDITKYKQIELEEIKIRSIVNNSRDFFYRFEISPSCGFSYISPSVESVLGYSVEECYKDYLIAFRNIHPDDVEYLLQKIQGQMDFSRPMALRFLNKNGKYIAIEDSTYPIYDKNNNLIALEGICRNIQERKELEQKLEYLCYHDSLTGLFNRTHFDIQNERLNKEQNVPTGIIICDIDNLKLINDNLGHDTGDKVIKVVASLLKNNINNNTIIARIGGDEFAIILEGIDLCQVKDLVKKIVKSVKEYNLSHPELVIELSLGFSYNDCSNGYFDSIFKNADVNMYYNKQRKKNYNKIL